MANKYKTIIVSKKQTLIDIAMQEYGDATQIFTIALLNGISVTDNLSDDQQLIVDDVTVNEVIDGLSSRNIQPASNAGNMLGGIGYMGIGIDFIVS